MKTETITNYTFEAGDVIRLSGWLTVAIRNNGHGDPSTYWSDTNGANFSDEEARHRLERGTWEHVGVLFHLMRNK